MFFFCPQRWPKPKPAQKPAQETRNVFSFPDNGREVEGEWDGTTTLNNLNFRYDDSLTHGTADEDRTLLLYNENNACFGERRDTRKRMWANNEVFEAQAGMSQHAGRQAGRQQ